LFFRYLLTEYESYGCATLFYLKKEDVSPNHRLPVKHTSEKLFSNPLSFTLGSEIRKATYTIAHMCGNSALAADRSIPLDLLNHAKGLCFLTVLKIGCVVSGRVGTGLIIARRDNGSWSPPSAVGTVGLGYGAQIGGDITNYIIVLTTAKSIAAFASRGTVNLGAELGVAVGPLGRSAMGNLNAGETGIAAAYCYAHSKGLFFGISLEGSVLATRSDVNAKFYGKQVDTYNLLFENQNWTPRAAQPLYDALREVAKAERSGFYSPVPTATLIGQSCKTSTLMDQSV
jgi:lipid-binding SYLF domain-containing protein